MIRIRTGASWRHDPHLRAALRRADSPARAAAARGVVDALAVEIDGFDIAAGRAEGPLLPTLEALLRAIARVVAGAPHATVTFPDGELEIVIRRRGSSALLTVVALSRPSRVLASDVEVDVEELAAAALEASAVFCRELAEVLPQGGAREARRLRAAARDLRRVEAGPPPRPRDASRARTPRAGARPGRVTCVIELADEEGLLDAYEGGRADLGSLLAPGRVSLRGADGGELCALPGLPFLALRDVGAATDGLLAAVRRRDATYAIPLARAGREGPAALELDLACGEVTVPGRPPAPCPPLELARAFAEAALGLGRTARARNPRQAENSYLVELESAAAARLARIEELAEGDRPGAGAGAHARAAPRASQRALGPGRLRRVSFRRTFALDVGAPAGDGLLLAGGVVVVAGRAAMAGVERATGTVLWRGPGCELAAAVPGALLAIRDGAVAALSVRSGRTSWTRPLPGAPPASALALARGPWLLAEPGALTAVDPGSGRKLWRFEPPGGARLLAAAFGGVAVAGSDAGFLYGLDAAGQLAWRVLAPGPVVHPPTAAARSCLATAAVDPGAVLLAVDPASGARRWEAPLEFVPARPPLAWGRRVAAAGAVAGEAVVTAVGRDGAAAWSAAPPLGPGLPAAAPAGSLLVVRDGLGALAALGREGAVRWTRPAGPAESAPGAAAPAVARGTVVAPAGDGVVALDARTGELLGAVRGAAPSRLLVDAALGVFAMDPDGVAAGWRLGTHLSVV